MVAARQVRPFHTQNKFIMIPTSQSYSLQKCFFLFFFFNATPYREERKLALTRIKREVRGPGRLECQRAARL